MTMKKRVKRDETPLRAMEMLPYNLTQILRRENVLPSEESLSYCHLCPWMPSSNSCRGPSSNKILQATSEGSSTVGNTTRPTSVGCLAPLLSSDAKTPIPKSIERQSPPATQPESAITGKRSYLSHPVSRITNVTSTRKPMVLRL